MLNPLGSYVLELSVLGPATPPRDSASGRVTALVVRPATPPPPYGILTGVVVAKHESESGRLTGVCSGRTTMGLRLKNQDSRDVNLAGNVKHETITFP